MEDIDAFKEMKWCENHAIWFERTRDCPCCKAKLAPHLRGSSTVLKDSPEWNNLKKKKLLLPHFMIEDDIIAEKNSEFINKANLSKQMLDKAKLQAGLEVKDGS